MLLHYSIIWLFSDSLPHLIKLGARVPCEVNELYVECIVPQFSSAGMTIRGDCVYGTGTSYMYIWTYTVRGDSQYAGVNFFYTITSS